MKKVYIHPLGGLCNKMRVIATAYEQSKEIGAHLTVRWVTNPELICPMKDLFQLPSDIKVIDQKNQTIFERFIVKLTSLYLKMICKKAYKDDEVVKARKEGRKILSDKTLLIGYEALKSDYANCDYSIFTPNAELRKKAEERINVISDNGKYSVIGMHIRRTDNAISIKESPSEYFYQIIEAYRKKYGSAIRFYIATDSEEEREKFKKKYNTDQDKIVFFAEESVLVRESVEGIKDAYIELMTLSMTKRIYGSHWSSYSRVASAMQKIPMDCLTRDSIQDLLKEI